jgi:spore germination protein KA
MKKYISKKPKRQDLINEPLPNFEEKVSSSLGENEQRLRMLFHHCSDIVFRPIHMANLPQALLVYVGGLVDTKHLDEVLMKQMPAICRIPSQDIQEPFEPHSSEEGPFVAIAQIKTVSYVPDLTKEILAGNTALLLDGKSEVIILGIEGGGKRSIEEPSSESVIRGPREGFIENLQMNTSMIRRKIRTSRLKMKSLSIGELTNTDVVIAYIDGIASDALVQEVQSRLGRIQIDGILETGYLEELIEDLPYSPFPQVQNTERPDVVVANLLEGRVAILADGTPFVLIVPITFWGFMQASEDYYERYMVSSLLRVIRFLFLMIALFLPSLYIAATTFHQEMIPTILIMTVETARENTPFPALMEALMMEITFEALREAGVRLPKAIGSAVSIVGALVIGEAAVQAGIMSAPMVIIVSITGIASFTIPRYNFGIAVRMLRFPLMILAGTVGLYGITFGALLILIHLAGLRSFGIPYLSPVAPLIFRDLKDVFIRMPWWKLKNRPTFTGFQNSPHMNMEQKSGPDRAHEDQYKG